MDVNIKTPFQGLSLKKTYNNKSIVPSAQYNIDAYGIPDWDCISLELYNENIHIDKINKALPIMASRGCPYSCEFCSTYLTWGHKVRYRSVDLVISEIESNIEKYGIRNFHFYDDNLLLNKEWVRDFSECLLEKNIDIQWICLSRPELILKNENLLQLMQASGCKGFELGYETSDETLYNRMNKKNDKSYFIGTYELLKRLKFEMIEFLLMFFL